MNDQHAEQIMVMARKMRAETVQQVGSAVHVRFRATEADGEPLGFAAVRVARRGVHISALEHSACARGVRWSRELARNLTELDAAGRSGTMN